jgi:hypothetical protein
MFTSAAKQLFAALGKASPQDSQGLAGAVANCQQPLSHRGPVNLSPVQATRRDGTFAVNPWAATGGLPLPPAGAPGADLPSSPSPWNSYNTAFYFPTDNFFTQNQFFGGPTLHVGGPIDASSVYTQVLEGSTATIGRINVQQINGDPVGGPAGAPGQPGAAGAAGAAGADGRVGLFGFGAFRPIFYLGGAPNVAVTRRAAAAPHKAVRDGWVRPLAAYNVPTNAIAGGTVTIQPAHATVSVPSTGQATITPASVSVSIPSSMTVNLTPSTVSFSVPTGVTFNPDTCEVSFLGHATITVAGTAALSGGVTIDSYDTVSVASTSAVSGSVVLSGYSATTVASTTPVTATLSAQAAASVSIHAFSSVAVSSSGAMAAPGGVGHVVVQLRESLSPQVTVLSDAELKGVVPLNAQVLHPQ